MEIDTGNNPVTMRLRPYQAEAVTAILAALQNHNKVGLIAPTGCLTGDTVIDINRGGILRPYTLKRLFNCWNGNPDQIKYLKPFREGIPTNVRSWTGESIRLHEIEGVVYSGKKDVYLVELENGRSVRATACHKIMTKRGFVPAGQLITDGDLVMCDDKTRPGRGKKSERTRDHMVCNLWYHPYAVKTKTVKDARGYTKRVEIHRAIYECLLNGISLEEYKAILRTDEQRALRLRFVDPGLFHIHHKDGDHYNNEPSNLEMLHVDDHLAHHGDYSAFGQGIPNYSKVIRVTHQGVEDTYDIQCKAPHHNFVANGIVVHNSGKTQMFLEVTRRYLAQNPNNSVLILSHLSLLTTQTAARFATFAPHLPVGIFQAGESPEYTSRVIIGTVQTSRSGSKTDEMRLQTKWPVGLIIVDEAHYLDSESYNRVLSYYPQAKVVGCTATPFRSGALMTSYFDTIAFSISLQELINEGYLVPPRLLEVALDDTHVEDRMAAVAKLYLEHEKGRQAIVFMQSIEAAKQMRNVLDNHGVRARAVTSEIVGEEREKIFGAFHKGEIQVLTTVNVLTAGFDAPNVESIFMPYATTSPVTYLQRIGRGLRPYKGKTECRIYVCGDTPSISKQLYQSLQERVLEAGAPKPKKAVTFKDDLAWGEFEPTSEVYKWTQTVCETIQKMETIGATQLAQMLNEKKFPLRFLKDIAALRAAIPTQMPNLKAGHEAMTKGQFDTLKNAGFTEPCLDGISKNEASLMVAAVLNLKDTWRSRPFIIPSGKFAGQHVENTSFYYRQWIMQNNPNGEIASLIREWELKGGSYKQRAGKKPAPRWTPRGAQRPGSQ